MNLNYKLLFFFTISSASAAAIFFTVGWTTASDNREQSQQAKVELLQQLTEDRWSLFPISQDLAEVDRDIMRQHLQILSEVPHLAGQNRDEFLTEYIRQQWVDFGLEEVSVQGYETLLSFPDKDHPNLITIESPTLGVEFTSRYRESLDDLDESFIDAFLAYCPKGDFEGDVVYVNYARVEDFELLANESSQYYTNVTDLICMGRFGAIFRGNMVQNAADAGCGALILFSDPANVAAEGTDAEDVYPSTLWLPGTGIQRGTAYLGSGDPRTPLWPSIPNVYEVAEEEVLPPITCQPIGYDDAVAILSRLTGDPVPPEWVGGLPNLTYTLGGSFDQESCADCIARISVHNTNLLAQTNNVVGLIKGDVEPDRFVLIGNHRDAWGFGATDPSSGTAVLLEVARVLGKKSSNGWKPRRTIAFISWGSEEYGLLGSREFVEDFAAKLSERAVAYINTDNVASGMLMGVSTTPPLYHKAVDAMRAAQSPYDNEQSYYDYMATFLAEDEGLPTVESTITVPGSGSDHSSLMFVLGVPVYDVYTYNDYHRYPGLTLKTYPMYHTGFEEFYYVDAIQDPGFFVHRGIAQVNLFILRDLSDRILLNFGVEAYGQFLIDSFRQLEVSGIISTLNVAGITTEHWKEHVVQFNLAAKEWRDRYDVLKEEATLNPMLARALNDQMTKLDRAFLLPFGLPDRPEYRHSIISPSQFNTYGESTFPGILDLLYNFDRLEGEEREKRIHQLEKHVSDLMVVIKGAKDFLDDVSVIL